MKTKTKYSVTIENKKKFALVLIAVAALATACCLFVLRPAFAEANGVLDGRPVVLPDEPQLVLAEYRVSSGDSVWKIAEQMKPADMNVLDYIDLLYKQNNMKSSLIREGQVLICPTYVTSERLENE